jgi:hypothetical protein
VAQHRLAIFLQISGENNRFKGQTLENCMKHTVEQEMLQENGLSFVFDRQREGVNAKDGRLSYSQSFATLICYF